MGSCSTFTANSLLWCLIGAAVCGVPVGYLLAALLICFCLGAPANAGIARQYAVDQVSHGDTSAAAIEQALMKKDWEAMQAAADRAAQALVQLAEAPAAIPALAKRNPPTKADELRARVNAASEDLAALQQAIRDKDAARVEAALEKFRDSYKPLHEAASRPARTMKRMGYSGTRRAS